MTVVREGPEQSLDDQLTRMAERLTDIAGCVAAEAELATSVVRGMVDQTSRVAALAAGLEGAANLIEASVRQQAEALAVARAAFSANKPVIDALEKSVAGVAAISAMIATIANESRALSLNARIEASRTNANGSAFAAVAAEMSTLATRTKNATNQIADQATAIADDIGAANDVAADYEALVMEQEALLATSLEHAASQRDTSKELATITAEIAATVDRTAAAIGRVGANAVAAKVLARQLSKLGRHASD